MTRNRAARKIVGAVMDGLSERQIKGDPAQCINAAIAAARAGLGLRAIENAKRSA
jgi:hypothetical protein